MLHMVCLQTVGLTALVAWPYGRAWQVSAKLRKINAKLGKHLNKPDLSLRITCSAVLDHFKQDYITWHELYNLGLSVPAITVISGLHLDEVLMQKLVDFRYWTFTIIGGLVQLLVSRGYKWGKDKFFRKRESPEQADATPEQGGKKFRYTKLSDATGAFCHRLGSGASSSVYKGQIAGTPVAVKKLDSSALSSRAVTAKVQFETEVQVLWRLSHPNLVRLLGFSNDGPNLLLVYELMEGSLEDRLTCRGNYNPLSALQRVEIMRDVARALAFMHKEEPPVIHRDVKSANVLLGSSGAKLGDFGVTRILETDRTNVTHLQTEHVIGTQLYMAPEYKNGTLSVKVDSFSFGLVALECLTGLPVVQPSREHSTLLDLWEDSASDSAEALVPLLDRRAGEWSALLRSVQAGGVELPSVVRRLHAVVTKCLQSRRRDRSAVCEFVHTLNGAALDAAELPIDH